MTAWEYLQAVLSRTRVDTCRWIRAHAVIEFLIIVVAFPIAFFVQGAESIRQLVLSIMVSLAALGTLIIAVFLVNLLIALFRLQREAVARAADTESTYQQKLSGLEEKVAALEENRPSIEVTVVNDRYRMMFLEVTNLGEHGDFEAQIEMLEGHRDVHGMERPTLPTYAGCWELGLGPKASLAQGHSDRLVIGKLEMQPPIWNAEFYMYFYDARAGQAKHYGTISWSPGGGFGMPARFVLRIAISSTPSMKQGPFVRTYLVDGEGDPHLQELPNATESVPDTEGSPTG